MIQTWIADVTPLLEEQIYRKYYALLPGWRKEKADQLRLAQDRTRSVGAWILYQRMLEEYECSGEAVYNLSHSGRYALCSLAVSEIPKRAGDESLQNGNGVVKLGCDVEMIGEFRPKLAKRFFCLSEEAYILEQNTPELRTETFYRYWVLKESFVKATRQGLKIDLRSFEICMKDGEPELIRQPEEYPEKYYYREYHVAAGDARAAVCSTDPELGELRAANIFAD